jgi:flagellar motility protein MotE (MotC chaperone)
MKPVLAYLILSIGTMVLALLTVYAAYSVKPDLFIAQQAEVIPGKPSAQVSTDSAPQDSTEQQTPASAQSIVPEDTLLVLHRTVLRLQDSVRVLTTLLEKERAVARSNSPSKEPASAAADSFTQHNSRGEKGVSLPSSLDSVVRTDPVAVAKVIETMNVDQAVKVLEQLNDDEARSILKNMNKRQAGKILSASDPKRVAKLIR